MSLSWLLSNKLLYLFALADKPRQEDSRDESSREENLHLWKLVAEENVLASDQPYPFANDHARFLFYRQGSDQTCTTCRSGGPSLHA